MRRLDKKGFSLVDLTIWLIIGGGLLLLVIMVFLPMIRGGGEAIGNLQAGICEQQWSSRCYPTASCGGHETSLGAVKLNCPEQLAYCCIIDQFNRPANAMEVLAGSDPRSIFSLKGERPTPEQPTPFMEKDSVVQEHLAYARDGIPKNLAIALNYFTDPSAIQAGEAEFCRLQLTAYEDGAWNGEGVTIYGEDDGDASQYVEVCANQRDYVRFLAEENEQFSLDKLQRAAEYACATKQQERCLVKAEVYTGADQEAAAAATRPAATTYLVFSGADA